MENRSLTIVVSEEDYKIFKDAIDREPVEDPKLRINGHPTIEV